MDASQEETSKLKRDRTLPKAVYFNLVIKFLGGIGAWLSSSVFEMYKLHGIGIPVKISMMIYHGMPIFELIFFFMWGIISDNTLGKIPVIIISCIFMCIGSTIFTLSSVDSLGIPKLECFLGVLVFGAILTTGAGSAFATLMAQQFVLPDQIAALEFYYMLIYWISNVVGTFGMIFGPIMRQTGCLGMQYCFILPFGIDCAMNYVNFGIFLCGIPYYRIRPIKKNIVVDVVNCIWISLKGKITSNEKKEHWLEYGEEKYGKTLTKEIRMVGRVLVISIPSIFFSMIYSQQGTTFLYQARRMKGTVGTLFTILPDQIYSIDTFYCIVLIPIFEYIIFPLSEKYKILHTPLQRLITSYVLLLISFMCAAVLNFIIDSTLPEVPSEGTSQLRIYNTLNEQLIINCDLLSSTPIFINNLDMYANLKIPVKGKQHFPYNFTAGKIENSSNFELEENKMIGYYFSDNELKKFEDDITKDEGGLAKVRTLINTKSLVNYDYQIGSSITKGNSSYTDFVAVKFGTYKFTLNKKDSGEKYFDQGGVYVNLIDFSSDTKKYITITEPNNIHILWQSVQYFFLVLGEILENVTGSVFCYSQSPMSMKVVVSVVWSLSSAFGNLIVVFIELISVFSDSVNLVIYCVILLLDIIFFIYLALKYKYVTEEEMTIQEQQ